VTETDIFPQSGSIGYQLDPIAILHPPEGFWAQRSYCKGRLTATSDNVDHHSSCLNKLLVVEERDLDAICTTLPTSEAEVRRIVTFDIEQLRAKGKTPRRRTFTTAVKKKVRGWGMRSIWNIATQIDPTLSKGGRRTDRTGN
jgi:hypothetical protein